MYIPPVKNSYQESKTKCIPKKLSVNNGGNKCNKENI